MALPPPPSYFTQFTSSSPSSWPDPPKAPEGDEYQMFGAVHSLVHKQASLTEFGCEQLFSDDADHVQSLKALNRSLMLEYLKLINMLVTNTPGQDKQVDTIKVHLLNMHYLLNQFRPAEALENVKLIARNQLHRRQQALAELVGICDKTRETLATCAPLFKVELPPPTDAAVDTTQAALQVPSAESVHLAEQPTAKALLEHLAALADSLGD